MPDKNIEFKLKHFTYSHINDNTFNNEYLCTLNDFCNRDCEIFCIIEGKGKLNIHGESYLLFPGDFVIIKPFELHKYSIDFQAKFNYIHARINACCLSQLSRQLKEINTVYKFSVDMINMESRNFEQLYDSCPEMMRDGFMCSTALTYFKDICNCNTLRVCNPTTVNNVFSSVIRYTYNNYTTIDSMEHISKALSVHKEKIRRMFLHRMDIHVTDLIKKLRLFAAEDLLANGESINKVLQEVGFTSYSTFLRAYKNQYKHLPSKHIQREDQYPLPSDFNDICQEKSEV